MYVYIFIYTSILSKQVWLRNFLCKASSLTHSQRTDPSIQAEQGVSSDPGGTKRKTGWHDAVKRAMYMYKGPVLVRFLPTVNQHTTGV